MYGPQLKCTDSDDPVDDSEVRRGDTWEQDLIAKFAHAGDRRAEGQDGKGWELKTPTLYVGSTTEVPCGLVQVPPPPWASVPPPAQWGGDRTLQASPSSTLQIARFPAVKSSVFK